jgi:hypothetical protein
MTDKSQSFRDVIVWQKAHAFVLTALQADLEEVLRLLQGYINGIDRGGS